MRISALAPLILPMALMAGVAAAQSQGGPQERRTVSVTGVAEVSAAPDMATVTIGVEAQEKSARAAMDEVAKAVGPVLERLSEAGVAPTDVRTSSLNLSPVYRRDPNDPSRQPLADGFQASTTLTVRVRELGRLGPLLDQVVSDGANRMQGLSLGLQDEAALLAEARRAAVRDAMAKAKLYAEAAGVPLGDVLHIAEPGVTAMPRMAAREMSMDAVGSGMPIAEGEITIGARVEMVIALGN